jgi:hypothetical protein
MPPIRDYLFGLLLFGLLLETFLYHAPSVAGTPGANTFLSDNAVREALIDHTLKGHDWIEFYSATGQIVGKARYFGVHAFKGRWTVSDSKVCYEYDEPRANTCSWLRRDGERVTHHHYDGRLKKDGVATRWPGNRIDAF